MRIKYLGAVKPIELRAMQAGQPPHCKPVQLAWDDLLPELSRFRVPAELSLATASGRKVVEVKLFMVYRPAPS